MPPSGKRGSVSVFSSSSLSPEVAESKTDREGEESETDGSQLTESMPLESGLFSSSSVMRKGRRLFRPSGEILGCRHDATAEDSSMRDDEVREELLNGSTNADAIDDDQQRRNDNDRGIVDFMLMIKFMLCGLALWGKGQ